MKYVIIGTSAAGITAAEELRKRQSDADIVMISADEYVHSRCMLHKYLSHERTAEELDFTEEGFFKKNRISWIQGRVTSLDTEGRAVCLASGEKVSYDKLLIASGANSSIPPVGDLRKAENVCGLRHLSDAQKIDAMSEKAQNVLVIGSGLVGLDAAYGLLDRGKNVTVVEMADQILPMQLDAHAAQAYQKLFEKAGVKFFLGKSAKEASCGADGMIHEVILDTGEVISCDVVIAATGVRPATEFLEGSGIEINCGIQVNSRMETSRPDVYAAGDVTGLSGIWPNAMKQGRTAARNMCGDSEEYTDTFAQKNTINFFGLVTLCLGELRPGEGDRVVAQEDRSVYRRAILRDGKLAGILLQGDISNSGIWQYIIKNKIDLGAKEKNLFKITFADFYGTGEKGKYVWNV
nr:FAD-dependent oxidoreductase [uncultured Mediterraneibacter sp.]